MDGKSAMQKRKAEKCRDRKPERRRLRNWEERKWRRTQRPRKEASERKGLVTSEREGGEQGGRGTWALPTVYAANSRSLLFWEVGSSDHASEPAVLSQLHLTSSAAGGQVSSCLWALRSSSAKWEVVVDSNPGPHYFPFLHLLTLPISPCSHQTLILGPLANWLSVGQHPLEGIGGKEKSGCSCPGPCLTFASGLAAAVSLHDSPYIFKLPVHLTFILSALGATMTTCPCWFQSCTPPHTMDPLYFTSGPPLKPLQVPGLGCKSCQGPDCWASGCALSEAARGWAPREF